MKYRAQVAGLWWGWFWMTRIWVPTVTVWLHTVCGVYNLVCRMLPARGVRPFRLQRVATALYRYQGSVRVNLEGRWSPSGHKRSLRYHHFRLYGTP